MKVMSELEGRLEEDYYGKITYGMHKLLCLAPYSLVLFFFFFLLVHSDLGNLFAGQLGWMGGGYPKYQKDSI